MERGAPCFGVSLPKNKKRATQTQIERFCAIVALAVGGGGHWLRTEHTPNALGRHVLHAKLAVLGPPAHWGSRSTERSASDSAEVTSPPHGVYSCCLQRVCRLWVSWFHVTWG